MAASTGMKTATGTTRKRIPIFALRNCEKGTLSNFRLTGAGNPTAWAVG